ncbi:MAG: hypothetical protein JW726_11290 [Anaerolineales bacterium]|nr:hypothetical protein [Anaerolineales bacterium]
MATTIDLSILSLAWQAGQESSDLPGLYAVTAPKRPARGREADSLIIYLGMAGNAPLSAEQYNQLLPLLAQKYYKTPGSVTAALRTIADALNTHLLNRNLRSTNAGKQGIGLLILAVLRNDTIYLAHSGPVHTFIVTPQETQHYHDPQTSGRGLGVSRTTPIRFLQARLATGDFMLLSPQIAPGWSASTLTHPARQGMEGMRRTLQSSPAEQAQVALVQAQPGSGQIRLLRRKLPYTDMARPSTATPPSSQPQSAPQEASPLSAPAAEPLPQPAGQDASTVDMPAGASEQAEVLITPPPLMPLPQEPPPSPESPPLQPPPRPATTPAAAARTERPAAPPRPRRDALAPLRTVLGDLTGAVSGSLRLIARGLGRLLRNLLPDESTLHLSPSVLIFLAVAVPLTLSAVGAWVYVQRGRTQRQQALYAEAAEAAEYAATLTDPAEQHTAWAETLDFLDQADFYRVTEQSTALRTQARTALDQLDWVERLVFEPAILGGLGSDMQVTRLLATETDLYLLNGPTGNVLHALLTGRGYEIDANFICGSTPSSVGPLVDIVALPPGSVQNAALMGMDANGNLLYCINGGDQPLTATLAPPAMNFGQLKAFVLNAGDLYVLDPDSNAVWIYRNMDIAQPPRFFFGDDVPEMADIVDLIVDNDDLFLLHSDGHVTKCSYSGLAESPTRCEEPYPFTDPRPGRPSGSVIRDALFNQIYFSPPPEPSLYLLDPSNQAVYFFSVRLNLQRQYRPSEALADGQATAFAISPNRLIFMAFGNQVFYAALP